MWVGGLGRECFDFRHFLKRGFSFFRERLMRPPISHATRPLTRTRQFHYDLLKKTAVRAIQMTASTPIGTRKSAFKYLLFSILYRFPSSNFHNLPSITIINTQFATSHNDQSRNQKPQRCRSHLQNIADDRVL